jgi:hypothetical protein
MQTYEFVVPAPLVCAAALLAFASGCGQQAPKVWVVESPQEVTLTASASASTVPLGESVTLHVERRTSGQWKQISRDQLRAGQCWQYRPPPQSEPEVADNVEWQSTPKHGISFDGAVRMDHKRVVTMRASGTVTLVPLSAVPCEPGRVVEGPPIQIEVS